MVPLKVPMIVAAEAHWIDCQTVHQMRCQGMRWQMALLMQAEELEIPILSEEDWNSMVGAPG